MAADCIFCRIQKGRSPPRRSTRTPAASRSSTSIPSPGATSSSCPATTTRPGPTFPPDLLADLAKATQKVAVAVKKATGSEGFNLLMNNHRCSGQAIFHAHFHVIPRKTNDGIKYDWKTKPYPSPAELEKAAGAIRDALK